MKITKFMFGVTITAMLCFGSLTAFAVLDVEGGWLPEKPEVLPEISISDTFSTKYIWRGWNLGDEPVMQTDVSISTHGFTFDFWTNYTMNDEKSRNAGRYQEFTEIDYSLDYTFNFGEMSEVLGADSPDILDQLSVSSGYTYYTFPNVDWDSKFFDSHEVYMGAAYNCFLQPSFTWYSDIDDGRGSYYLFGIGHTFDFKDSGMSVGVGLTTGIIDEQWTDKTGWADMVFSGAVSVPIFNYFVITPSVAYSLILDREVYGDASENEFYGGISIGFAY